MAPILHPLFADHAVLQRERPLPIRGRAAPGALVRVACAGAAAAATAGADGTFCVLLPALPAGGPHVLRAATDDGEAVARDVLIGDVFLCSGQSNMEWPLKQSAGGDAEIAAAAAQDGIRIMIVPQRPALEPRADLDAAWQPAGPDAAARCSAVAWYAARRLRHELPGVPVGLIVAAWGGTPAEPWISGRGLALLPPVYARLGRVRALARLRAADPAAWSAARDAMRREFMDEFAAWQRTLHAADGGEAAGLHAADADIAGWREHPVPGFWPNAVLGSHEGAVWFAVDVDLPAAADGRPGVLHLGSVDNEDTTWINGHRIGCVDMTAGPMHWNLQRDYGVPAGVLRAGRNRLAVRVVDYGGRGGFGGGPEAVALAVDGAIHRLPAVWRCKLGSPLASPRPIWPAELNETVDAWTPSALFNGMIAPLLPVALAGAWWYQGESNVGDPAAYRRIFAALIQDWRAWNGAAGDGEGLPFHWVQLTSFKMPPADPGQASPWACLREAQASALALLGTAQAVIYDCGDAEDIHPADKRTPGERLAALRLARVEGRPLAADGPRLLDVAPAEGSLRARWLCAGGLRTRDGGPLRMLAIAGADRRWRWAEARIDGDAVVASHPEVPRPVAMRYAWADNAMAANLTDATGLPAWPARSDDWIG